MDEFEKLIKQNESKFNDHIPNRSKMWDAISAELDEPETKVIPLWKSTVFKIAAGVIIVLGIVGVVNLSIGLSNNSNQNFASVELQEIDMYYQNMMEFQINLVEKSTDLSASNKNEFLEFVNELDEEYSTLKLDLADNLDNELVLEAIVNNYKKRIELIENLLQQIKNSKNNSDDDVYIL